MQLLSNIDKVKGTVNIKLDDEDFEATQQLSIKFPTNTGWVLPTITTS